MPAKAEPTARRHNDQGLGRPRDVAIVACVSGLLGFLVGALAFPSWHHAIETAQTFSLAVNYPSTAPDLIYHAKAWNLIHQVLTVLMQWSISDRALALGLSGVVGTVLYMALAFSVFALSDDRFLSIISAPIIHFALAPFTAQPHIVQLMGQASSYGSIALGLGVLAVAAASLGGRRLAAFIFGLLPAIHFVFAVFFWLTALAGAVWSGRRPGDLFKEEAPFFMAGFAVTAASLASHIGAMPKSSLAVDLAAQARYLHTSLAHWSSHNLAVQSPPAYLVNWAVALIALIWIAYYDRPATSRSLIRTFFVSAIVGGLLSAGTLLAAPDTSDWLRQAIPGRFLSISIMAFMPMLVGMLGYQSGRAPAGICLVLFAGAITLVRKFHLPQEELTILIAGIACFSAASLFTGRLGVGEDREPHEKPSSASGSRARFLLAFERAALVMLLLIGPVPWFAQAYLDSAGGRHLKCAFPGPLAEEDPIVRTLRHRRGPMITSSIEFAQLASRRPVVASSDLTSLIDMPEAGPRLEKALGRIYGVESFHPEDMGNRYIALPRDLYRRTWETRALEEWMRIRSEFGVTDILTCGDWRLQLPQVGASKTFTVYTIPVKKNRR